MIKIEKTTVKGFDDAVRGMRNPMNSWDRSDSGHHINPSLLFPGGHSSLLLIGENGLDLMTRLAEAGSDHAKYRRMIVIWTDIVAPLYWWKEFDTYKVGTVANSCSTMHTIQNKEFTIDDFSHEHLLGPNDISREADMYDDTALAHIPVTDGLIYCTPLSFLYMACAVLNHFRELYLKTGDKTYWWQMIQLLPSSYNQRRTVMLNYEVLANIYHARKNHKLDEWRDFCKWIETLPYADGIIFQNKSKICSKEESDAESDAKTDQKETEG